MGSSADRPVRHGRLERAGANALVAGLVLVSALAIASAFHVTPALALGSCDLSSSTVSVHYQMAVPASGQPLAISAISLSGFPSGCNGSTVKLELRGNSAGDPTVAASADTLMSTANSTRDPCTQATLASARVVTGGTIDLPLCATGGASTYVRPHDLTRVSLFINGSSTPVGGVAGISTTVPSTGLAQRVFNALFGVGLGLLIVGLVALVAAGRARRRPD